MSGFSATLKLTDLNDFIQPSQACIKPVESGKKNRTPNLDQRLRENAQDVEEEQSGSGIKINRSKAWKARRAAAKSENIKSPPHQSEAEAKSSSNPLQVTLGDCLACSGCITSAEAVLIGEQSDAKVLQVLKQKRENAGSNLVVVLTLSLQSIASLAAKYRLSMQQTAEKLAHYFVDLGVDYVVDIAIGRHIALVESAREFIRSRSRANQEEEEEEEAEEANPHPGGTILSSTCPGFVCYAEKSQGDALVPMLSRVKSPQQIMGWLVKKRLDILMRNSGCDAKTGQRPQPNDIYHITLMPCYDKKLEASRLDNRIAAGSNFDENDESLVPEVDCVITPIELERMLRESGIDNLADLGSRPLDYFYADFYPLEQEVEEEGKVKTKSLLRSHRGSGAGGFAENIFRFIAAELYGRSDLSESPQLRWSATRNNDYLELKLYESEDSTEESGDRPERTLLSFAILNGFRNIQNLVSRVKRNTCAYDYVEVSACPKGCLNGGAQTRKLGTTDSSADSASMFTETSTLYSTLSTEPEFGLQIPRFEIEQLNNRNRLLYEALRLHDQHERILQRELRTHFKLVPKIFNILQSNW